MEKKVLRKDLIIPKGTVFIQSPTKTIRYGGEHFSATIGLTRNTFGEIEYCIDADHDELSEWFADLKE